MELDGLVGWMLASLFARWLRGWFFLSVIIWCVKVLAGCRVYCWLFRLVGWLVGLLEDTR